MQISKDSLFSHGSAGSDHARTHQLEKAAILRKRISRTAGRKMENVPQMDRVIKVMHIAGNFMQWLVHTWQIISNSFVHILSDSNKCTTSR